MAEREPVAPDDRAEFTTSVLPGNTRFAAPAELSLLEAALLEGVSLPNSCRNGTCRACASRLHAGTIRYRIEWPGLSLDEREEGLILPCVACPASDVVIEPVSLG
ncbi:Ferredoxin [Cupriavidus necator]|uniref:2Fe-2S iron-sulfur cluster binding domain-containing protein n=1 Tax=Cupriavidus necator (strain ATCC 17699 / DSM 428 / KCTC 22496 / NCIMB 10442 / H16 / Stanier 337) TaxID=381666 RepID=Q0JYJ2_CUPNH|nr:MULTISPECIES: 2Fe-2S iron-sulfur cluster-binding protein [Cupriavidus]EON20012.1 ferredoxin [Cupriavidus sp. GA3-3]QCC04951.1 2Fe-2S iron-sulfur cluster binding domain-containing protein [Cupriavidus necator H16]QQB79638.1 2Fe-2S iron-sulfur cluster binding domain-containing protein [Cupriavidus necator]WKA43881.1 2Fe-2S iron-sulfur cluster-binding protein [Cupriavidus necator]CAJ97182.1 Ferredoxin / 2Fe-2S iron-sulfur cluster binding domain [Cupriavidus necator H16]